MHIITVFYLTDLAAPISRYVYLSGTGIINDCIIMEKNEGYFLTLQIHMFGCHINGKMGRGKYNVFSTPCLKQYIDRKKQQKSTISLMKSNLPTTDYDEK